MFYNDNPKWRMQIKLNQGFTKQNTQQIRINNKFITAMKGLSQRVKHLEDIIKNGDK